MIIFAMLNIELEVGIPDFSVKAKILGDCLSSKFSPEIFHNLFNHTNIMSGTTDLANICNF